MKIRRSTETVVETHEVWVIRRSGDYLSPPCVTCPNGPPMAKPEDTARLAGVSTRTVYQWIEAGRVHFAETPEGDLFVCPASIPALPR